MEVKYSDHLQFKLRVRRIPRDMPERIYRESTQRYYNHLTLRHVAVMQLYHQRRQTSMMIAYDQHPDHAEIITIHPITRRQIQDRLSKGRWTDEQTNREL